MKNIISIFILFIAALGVAPAQAQDNANRMVVTFSDPARTGLVKVNLANGAITVKTHPGREVIIESKSRGRNLNDQIRRRGQPPAPRPDGLRRIDTNESDIVVEEENNVVTINQGFTGSGDIEIQVPVKTNLNLRGVNGRSITVEGVEGEIEVNHVNGDVQLTNVAGSVVAHSVNGRLVVSLRDVSADKPMSFSSQNGNVDVTLPATAKANLKMRSDHGGTYTDFDIQLRQTTQAVVDDSRNRGGRFRLQTDKTLVGTINGGGPDFDIRSLNGDIYLRKAK